MLRVSRTGEGRYDIDDVLERLAAVPASAEPARFAVHNIVLTGGAADFIDRPLATTHRVRNLELAIPFVSSLPSEREIKVEPHLAFALDGSRFDSAGAATPFAERGNGELRVKLDGFAVAPYLGYLPRGLPAQLRAATLNADVVVAFEQRPTLSLKVAGVVGATGIEVVDAAANDLLKVGNVKVQIDELRPLERAGAPQAGRHRCAACRRRAQRRRARQPPARRRRDGRDGDAGRPRAAADCERAACARPARRVPRAAPAHRRRRRRRGASASPRSPCTPAASTGAT